MLAFDLFHVIALIVSRCGVIPRRLVGPRLWSIVTWNCPNWFHHWRPLQPSWPRMHPCKMRGLLLQEVLLAGIITLICRPLCSHNHNNQLQPLLLLLLGRAVQRHLLNVNHHWHLHHPHLPPLPPPCWLLAKYRLRFWSACPPTVSPLARLRLSLAPPLSRLAIPNLVRSSWQMRHRSVNRSIRPRPLIILQAPVERMPLLSLFR